MPKKRDLLTYKRCPQPPTLFIIPKKEHTHIHTHPLTMRKQWNQLNTTGSNGFKLPISQHMYNQLSPCTLLDTGITAEDNPLDPEPVLMHLQCGGGYDLEQVLTPCCNQNWEEGIGAQVAQRGDTWPGLGDEQRLARGTESKAAPPRPLWALPFSCLKWR